MNESFTASTADLPRWAILKALEAFKMRVVLTPQGTHGDVRPLVALGQRLRSSGHEVVFGAPPNCQAWIERLGLRFRCVGLDFETPTEEADRAVGHPFRSLMVGLRLLGSAAEAQFATLPDVAKGADLLVGSGLEFAGRSIAEKMGIPYLFVCHVPTALRSRHHPPVGIPYRPFPSWMNRMLWWSNGLVMGWTVGRRIQEHRRRLGLPTVRRIDRFLSQGVLLAADEALAPVPSDCSIAFRTPYWALEQEGTLDPGLEQFLSDGPPPVYFGFGSMADPDPQKTLELILGLPKDVRFVVSNERARRLCKAEPPNLHWISSVPHDLLFPRLAAIVHHGGAGTTHTAARAGVPQIVIPHIVDQYYWAHRVHRLGIGPAPLPRVSLSSQTLAQAISSVRCGSPIQQAAVALGRFLADSARQSLDDAERCCMAVLAAHTA